MMRRAHSWHALLSTQAVGAGGAVQGLPTVTCAAARSTSGDRGGAETIPFAGIQKCHALICFYRSTYSFLLNPFRKSDPARTLGEVVIARAPGHRAALLLFVPQVMILGISAVRAALPDLAVARPPA
jgi:hypothetical protein